MAQDDVLIRGETVVDHCNARTEYEMITHPYDPDNCLECHICLMIILTGIPCVHAQGENW